MSDTATLRFLPWLRRGFATSIQEEAAAGVPSAAAAVVEVGVTVDGTEVTQKVKLRGPGDVVGLAAGQVVREEPKPGTLDFEPNYFPLVEFASPDLPWMFTPAAPDAQDRLMPWLVLVVVENRDGIAIDRQAGKPLPVLSIDNAALELPALDEAWAWAHVQTVADLSAGVGAALSAKPEAFISRLACPRRLQPGTRYTACVVPAFEQGRRAGLAIEFDEADISLAWTASTVSLELPVYHLWSFRTGSAGDFETLVRKLQPRSLPSDVGIKDLDVSDPGGSLPRVSGARVSFRGALVSTASSPRSWGEPHRGKFRIAMRAILGSANRASATPAGYDPLKHDPVVAPPVYGALATGASRVPIDGQEPAWLVEANLDPANRVVAGLGAEVVRRNQEQLMASAWEQARSLRSINHALARTRMSAEAGKSVKKKVDALDDASLLQISRPAHSRVRSLSGTGSFAGQIAQSMLPQGLLSASFRRTTRKGNASARITEKFVSSPVQMLKYAELVRPPGTQFADADFGANVTKAISGGSTSTTTTTTTTRTPVQRASTVNKLSAGQVSAAGSLIDRSVSRRTTVKAAGTLRLEGRVTVRPNIKTQLGMGQLRTDTAARHLRRSLNPETALAARLRARIGAPAASWRNKTLPESMKTSPEFSQPAFELLVRISREYLVPGVGDVPENTTGVLQVNGAFVEAFLLGANHELSREFMWREYPADLNGTWMRRFWDSDADVDDITAVRQWKTGALGDHRNAAAAKGSVVLLIKGDLLRRHPNTIIYAAPARWNKGRREEDAAGVARQPVFMGQLGRDTVFIGFDLTVAQVRGTRREADAGPGWFFVFEEHTTEPRFGLDEAKPAVGGLPGYWRDLAWSHLADKKKDFDALTHVRIGGRLKTLARLYDIPARSANSFRETWGANAAAMARITLQRPLRVLIHADSMLPDEGAK